MRALPSWGCAPWAEGAGLTREGEPRRRVDVRRSGWCAPGVVFHRGYTVRTTRLLALAIAATACGSSSSHDGALSGTIRGKSFTVVEAAFVGPESSDSCTIEVPQGSGTITIPYAPASVLLGFSSQAGICALAQAPCAERKSFGIVAGALVHARVGLAGPVTAPALDAGTYPVVVDPGSLTPDATGALRVALVSSEETDATCSDLASVDATGSIVVDAVSATEIRGTVSLTFSDGGRLEGPFVATRCAVSYDACTPAPPSCTGTPTCT